MKASVDMKKFLSEWIVELLLIAIMMAWMFKSGIFSTAGSVILCALIGLIVTSVNLKTEVLLRDKKMAEPRWRANARHVALLAYLLLAFVLWALEGINKARGFAIISVALCFSILNAELLFRLRFRPEAKPHATRKKTRYNRKLQPNHDPMPS